MGWDIWEPVNIWDASFLVVLDCGMAWVFTYLEVMVWILLSVKLICFFSTSYFNLFFYSLELSDLGDFCLFGLLLIFSYSFTQVALLSLFNNNNNNFTFTSTEVWQKCHPDHSFKDYCSGVATVFKGVPDWNGGRSRNNYNKIR